MPSQGKAAWNKEYYAKNADDILYRAKQERKVAVKIPCPCKENGYYKNIKSCKRLHFKTHVHQVYERKLRCVKILTDDFNYMPQKSTLRVDKEIQRKCGLEYTSKAAIKCLADYEFKLREQYIAHLENEDKPKDKPKDTPVTKNIMINKTELEQQPLQPPIANPLILLPVTKKNAIIPAHDGQGFDPMGLIRPLGWENDIPEDEPRPSKWREPLETKPEDDPNVIAFNKLGLE